MQRSQIFRQAFLIPLQKNAFEQLITRHICRTDISEMKGDFDVALIAKE
ncbi:MAG: hypothetical protein LBQ50_13545 [Planctomycetaceae bacterium]|jgi:hypothetical protein|nr:hypothetical protein [Planctomycetaceae bacterium]